MKTSALAVTLLLAGSAGVAAQEPAGSLARCLQAASAKQAGTFVKVEVEVAVSSTEAGAAAKGAALLELEVRDAQGKEWDLTCDEKSGKIIEVEQEVASATDPAFQAKAKVTEDEARKTALAAHPGTVVEVEYEIEANGAASYELDIQPTSGTGEIKVEVDAATGKLVEHRRELYQIGIEPSAETH
jgi:uncharacterized membrane protein YkoI